MTPGAAPVMSGVALFERLVSNCIRASFIPASACGHSLAGRVLRRGSPAILFQIFRDQVFHELTLPEFADAFAQMLAYGLFLARLNSADNEVTLQNARQYVSGSFRLIRELVDFLAELEKKEYSDIRWVVEEVLSIVRAVQRYLLKVIENMDLRPPRAAA